MEKVILIDGNNLLFRSYYATSYSGSVMKNSKGVPTNALYGFINMLNKIILEEKPNYIMIAFDKGKTFRHDKYDWYKEGRSETPDELKQQFPIAKRLVNAMGLKYYEIDNYEADDIIGTFSKKINEKDNFIGTIISSDRDLLQLITDEIEVKLLKQKDYIRYTKEKFIEDYGIEPINIIDLKSLMGDASDNIPGVKGIGEKTALKLLQEYKTLDNIYANIDDISGKLKEKLVQDKENAYISYDLATIHQEVDIDTDYENIKYEKVNTLEYIQILEELEFYSLIKKMNIPKDIIRDEKKSLTSDIKIISTKEELEKIKLTEEYAYYVEILGKNYHKDPVIGVGVYSKETSFYVPFDVLCEVPNFFNNELEKYTYDLKKNLVIFKKNNLKLNNNNNDLMIAAYLLNKNINDDIANLANNYQYKMEFYDNFYGINKKIAIPDLKETAELIVQKAQFIYQVRESVNQELINEKNTYLYEKIEIPLVEVLADMESTGVLIDRNYLDDMSVELNQKLVQLEKEIFDLAGEEFNVLSPKQLGEILFNKLNIPYPKKIKDNNYSTSKDILDKLKEEFLIVGKVLDYRTIAKLNSNYAVGLVNEIAPDGRIHTTFNQTLARTGRLSSVNPNLQNIPVRIEEGRKIRKAFIPKEGFVILSSDYSQVELRVFAHMSGAGHLIEAFNLGMDIHTQTAMDIYRVEQSEVTSNMRRTAKAVNFGILYGISSFGLSEDLGIDIASAKEFIDTYLRTYPGIKEYMNRLIKTAYDNGYVLTLMNRKRIIEELNNKNYMIRSQGERMALNTPIQGSAADILKKAMIEINNKLKELQLESKMIIQVHDELVFEVKRSELNQVQELVEKIMENTYRLSVPLKVEISSGSSWYEAK